MESLLLDFEDCLCLIEYTSVSLTQSDLSCCVFRALLINLHNSSGNGRTCSTGGFKWVHFGSPRHEYVQINNFLPLIDLIFTNSKLDK